MYKITPIKSAPKFFDPWSRRSGRNFYRYLGLIPFPIMLETMSLPLCDFFPVQVRDFMPYMAIQNMCNNLLLLAMIFLFLTELSFRNYILESLGLAK